MRVCVRVCFFDWFEIDLKCNRYTGLNWTGLVLLLVYELNNTSDRSLMPFLNGETNWVNGTDFMNEMCQRLLFCGKGISAGANTPPQWFHLTSSFLAV